jgi:hypothetical protein
MTINLTAEPDDESLIHELELHLAQLANDWRREHSIGKHQMADTIVQKYHSVFSELWALGWNGEGLLPDSELPDEIMPEYYIEKWR